MQQHYELLYLLSANYTADELPQIKKRVTDLLAENQATIKKDEDLGKQKLAFQIKKNSYGYYLLNEFDIESDKVAILNSGLKIVPGMIRFLITAKKEKTIMEIEKERKLQEKLTKAKEKEIEKIQKEKEVKPAKEPPTKITLEDLDKKLDEIIKGEDML